MNVLPREMPQMMLMSIPGVADEYLNECLVPGDTDERLAREISLLILLTVLRPDIQFFGATLSIETFNRQGILFGLHIHSPGPVVALTNASPRHSSCKTDGFLDQRISPGGCNKYFASRNSAGVRRSLVSSGDFLWPFW